MTKQPTKTARMLKIYGEIMGERCAECCNYHCMERDAKKHCCIAYDENEEWSATSRACGLFNRAFLGIRPKLEPLGKRYEKQAAHNEHFQDSLF